MEMILIIAVGVIFIFIFLKTNEGWKMLASKYSASNLIREDSIQWVKTKKTKEVNLVFWMGRSRQTLRTKVGANKDGILIKPFSLLTMLKPKLYIPWGDLTDSWHERKALGITSRFVKFDVRLVPGLSFGIRELDALELKKYSAGTWKSKTV